MSIVLVATITPIPDQMDAVEAIFKDLVPEVHQEEGCEMFALHRGKDCLVLVERWSDDDALKAHSSAESVQKLVRNIKGLIGAPAVVQRLEAVPCGDAEKGAL
jgi:quinol monooxygenase YgiN